MLQKWYDGKTIFLFLHIHLFTHLLFFSTKVEVLPLLVYYLVEGVLKFLSYVIYLGLHTICMTTIILKKLKVYQK